MTKVLFDKFLAHSIPRAILLYGENEFLITYYSDLITTKIGGVYQTIYFDYNHQEALNYLGVNSLFGDLNVLVLKLYTVLDKKQIQDLFFTLEHNPKSFLIVQFYKSPSMNDADYAKKFRIMSALFKPSAKLQDIIEMRCFHLSQDEMLKILRKRSLELELQIDSHLLEYLLNIQNNDLAIAYNELSKFIYFPNITLQLIDELSYSLGNMKMESLFDSLFDKKGHLIEIIQTLNEEGMDNMALLREIHKYFYILFKLYGHSKMYGNLDSKEALGYKPPQHIFNVWSRRSLKIKTQTYLALFDICNQWRIQQFQGKDVSLQFLIEIQQIL
ncbi:DNA polymerase III subunit delta [Helicobacter didelphidarum]|uniref:DNA polymerase III subunit delta n=1 Tax=Helicobacter didelphidarum TaxID=2040648 RepID=A0A3D8IEE3_9HELI|nr:DNA polymerase III subunit delta [Helicobacter didelphidarum]RDU63577.1 DNA polymerase III subunit delta [Helicobacter didelphidarum]